MGDTTNIPWCDHTHNEWVGCAKVGPLCKFCYAEGWGRRFGVEWGPGEDRRRTSEANRRKPYSWNRKAREDGVRRRVFCSSLSDVFEDHPQLSDWRRDLFAMVEECDALDWMLLTKRPENVLDMVPPEWLIDWPAHAWIGTSAGTQKGADERLPALRAVPARVRFVSAEPLLERVEFDLTGIHQLIVGCESGPKARPFDVSWMRHALSQARAARCAFFAKQVPSYNRRRATDELTAFPPDLRVREFPEVE